jgi:hypothetical protein
MDFPSFIAGVAATVIGFLLTIVWDVYKTRTENTRRHTAVLAVIRDETATNIDRLTQYRDFFPREIALIDAEKKYFIAPLLALAVPSLTLVAIDTPAVLDSPKQLATLRQIASNVEIFNETLRSRETYRINNQALSGLTDTLKTYDSLLLTRTDELLTLLRDFQTTIA